MHSYPDVTLLITHYNRSSSLERLLYTFQSLECSFGGIIVSDDGSKAEHKERLRAIQQQYGFNLVTTEKNRGLGNNINKGQDAVTTPYTLYVQEDFEPTSIFPAHFTDALAFMHNDAQLDIVRFYAYFTYPYKRDMGKGFSEMLFSNNPWKGNHLKYYVYSDHPHLRRSTFFQKFGRYAEGLKGDETEYRMAISFIRNNGRGLFYNDFTQLFYQKNSADEPSTMARADWRSGKNPFVLLLREAYLKYKLLKCTLDVKYKNI